MEVLYQYILPLFIERPPSIELSDDQVGQLIPIGGRSGTENSDLGNEYQLLVSLEQVIRGEKIRVMVPSDQPFEFEIPANYFEVRLTGKGFNGNDVLIQVVNRRDSRFLRIGSVDLVIFVSEGDQVIQHLDDSQIQLSEFGAEGKGLIKIPNQGIPIPGKIDNQERGSLYVIRGAEGPDVQLWLEILKTHENANRVVSLE